MKPAKFRILLYDTKYRNPNHYICLAILGALKRHPDVEFVAKADPLNAMSIAIEQRCNLFIAFDGEELNTSLCEQLASVCGRAVLWVTEDPYELSVNVRNAKLFDLIFTNDSSSVAAYGLKGVHLPLAGAVEFHLIAPLPPTHALRYELFFAGTAWPNRSTFLRSVLKHIPTEWNCKIALPTNPFLPTHGIDLPESSLSWRTSPIDFARFVNRSAITLMLPRVFSASGGREYAETPPPRLFEAALAGGVQMVHDSLAEVDQSFRPGQEIVLFSSEQDFLEKATGLVNDRSYRNAIAEAAHSRARKFHTYDNRVNAILDKAIGIPTKQVQRQSIARKTLLFVTHNIPSRGNFGGVEVYLDRLKGALGADWNVLFYAPDMTGRQQSAHVLSCDYDEIEHYTFSQSYSPALLTCEERERAFRQILHEQRVDFVHFHHFIGHVPSLVYVAAQMGVPTAFTAHDYFGVCNEFNLISFKNEFCGAPDVSISQCDTCLLNKRHIASGSQAQRRAFWDDIFRHVNLLVFNTEYSRDTYARIYPAVRQHPRLRVLPVPIPDGDVRHKSGYTTPLKIALLGNVTFQKGGEVLARALPMLAAAPVEFHIFGRVDAQYAGLANRDKHSNVVVHGPYTPDALPNALRECDVSLHISIWPETYCLTLSEAWQLGIVPIVTDIGALGERVRHMVNGLKVRPDSEGSLIDAIYLLQNSPELLDSLRAGISSMLFSELRNHSAEIRAEYSELLATAPAPITSTADITHTPIREMGIVLQSASWQRGGPVQPVIGGNSYIAQAKRLHYFYRSNGIGPTLRLLANRIRIRR
ncbi:TPA: glycosyltransferase [Burkholderia vietnamiensis]|nr:glycosyltransferase [Burkholderia vietnamiensis]HDR9236154.1 glycosyltransferase [Burkholderia vietnamiensis]